MRLTLLTNYDAASSLALRYLLPELNDHKLTVFYTDKPATLKPTSKALKELSQFERSLAGFETPFLASNAKRLNHINQEEGMRCFVESEPELVVSIRHMSILKEPAISIPKHGVINLHSGLLPSYRGVMATFWAMKNGEQKIGTTLHTVDDRRIDTGQIISQSAAPIAYDKSYLWNTLSLYERGCLDIINAVKIISTKETLTFAQQPNNGNYFSFPTQQDIERCNFKLFYPKEAMTWLCKR